MEQTKKKNKIKIQQLKLKIILKAERNKKHKILYRDVEIQPKSALHAHKTTKTKLKNETWNNNAMQCISANRNQI